MRKILLLISVSSFALLSLFNKFIGASILRRDLPNAVMFALDIADAVWAWLSGPPPWAATLALFALVAYAISESIGRQRRLELLRVIFKRDSRIAALKQVIENPNVIAFQRSCKAERALQLIDFTRIPNASALLELADAPEGVLERAGFALVMKSYHSSTSETGQKNC